MNDAGTLLPTLYAADEAGGWNTGMRAISHAVLAGVAVPSGPQLELGCGGGAFVRELAALAGTDSPVVGLDLRGDALLSARRRAAGLWVNGNLLALPFAAATFALIAALDVLDQAGVDAELALAQIHNLLRPGGAALLRVSAHPGLYGPHDVAFGTGRRYTRDEFVRLVRRAGLLPQRVTYANCLLAPAVAAVRLGQRWGVLPFSESLYTGTQPHHLLATPLHSEAAWLRRHDLPWGISLLVVASRL